MKDKSPLPEYIIFTQSGREIYKEKTHYTCENHTSNGQGQTHLLHKTWSWSTHEVDSVLLKLKAVGGEQGDSWVWGSQQLTLSLCACECSHEQNRVYICEICRTKLRDSFDLAQKAVASVSHLLQVSVSINAMDECTVPEFGAPFTGRVLWETSEQRTSRLALR